MNRAMLHSFDRLTLNVKIPLSLVQTQRQALSITSDTRTQMEDNLSDMAGGNWCHLLEMRHKYCQFQDLCLYNLAGSKLKQYIIHPSCYSVCQEPLIGNGGKCPSYKLRSASSYCFCLFLEKQRLGTEESVDFLENVYFDCLTSTNPQVFSWIHPCHPRTAYTHMGCFLWLSLDVIFVYLLHLDEYLFTF